MENTNTQKSYTVTALLCYFLGTLGIHKFYTGEIKGAVIMLVLTLTGIGVLITGIWNLVDMIKLLTNSYNGKDGEEVRITETSDKIVRTVLIVLVIVGIIAGIAGGSLLATNPGAFTITNS